MKKSFSLFVAAAVSAGALVTVAPQRGAVAAAATPPPTPPPLPAIASTPFPIPTPAQNPKTPDASASGEPNIFTTPSPPPNARKGVEGVWEVQVQRGTDVEYVHFKLKQDDNALTGVYLDKNNKQFPLAGSLDGQNVRIVVTLQDGTSLTFTGTLDGTTDMLGMLTSPTDSVPFTAAYRPKEDFLNNINAGPSMGGASSSGGATGSLTPP